MNRITRIAILTLMVVCGVLLAAQNARTPPAEDNCCPSQVPNVRPAWCTSPGTNNIASSNSVPDPNCTNANHPLVPSEKGGTGETGPYQVVPDFFKPKFPKGWTWGRVGGIFAES